MNNPINNELFDSRDLIEYKEYLESELVDSYNFFLESIADANGGEFSEVDDISDVDLDNKYFRNEENEYDIKHYEAILEFTEELSNYSSDFESGETIIHKDYFTDYSRALVQDCGYLPEDLPFFIEYNIDWDGVADDLLADYTSVEYEGNNYYIR